MLGLVVLQIRTDRAVPVDLLVPWTPVSCRTVESTSHRLAQRFGQSPLDLVDALANDDPRGLLRLGGHDA